MVRLVYSRQLKFSVCGKNGNLAKMLGMGKSCEFFVDNRHTVVNKLMDIVCVNSVVWEMMTILGLKSP